MDGGSHLQRTRLEHKTAMEGHKNFNLLILWKYTIILVTSVMKEGGTAVDATKPLHGIGTTHVMMLGNILQGLSHKAIVTSITIHIVCLVIWGKLNFHDKGMNTCRNSSKQITQKLPYK
jgi:hypothetical protein